MTSEKFDHKLGDVFTGIWRDEMNLPVNSKKLSPRYNSPIEAANMVGVLDQRTVTTVGMRSRSRSQKKKKGINSSTLCPTHFSNLLS